MVAAATALALAGGSVAAGGLLAGGPPQAAATGESSVSARPNASASPPRSAEPAPGGGRSAVSSAAAPVPPKHCTISRLTPPGGAPMALVGGADPTGRYIVGRSYPKGGGYQAVIWVNGKGADVAMPGDSEENLEDVNGSGTAVGWSFDATDAVPYVYQNGRTRKLAGVAHGQAYAINEAGKIAGSDNERKRPVVWPSPGSDPVTLPTPAGLETGVASDVDEDGTVVGNVGGGRFDDGHPYVWLPDGSHHELPLPTIGGVQAAASVYTIHNGWATGVAGHAPGTAVRWNVHTAEVRTYPAFLIRASTANAYGWLVGTDQQGRGLLVTDAGSVVLPDLSTHKAGELTNIATTISDDGRTIAGQADDRAGVIQAVVWRCS
jgi:uncharacterized membrane protein